MEVLSSDAREAVVTFLRDDRAAQEFSQRLDEWAVTTDAVEEAGFIHHAQQLRALVHVVRAADRRFKFTAFRLLQLDRLRLGAANLLTGDATPREIWGDIVETADGLFLDSAYARGFYSLALQRLPQTHNQFRFYRVTYAGYLYSGRSRGVDLSLFRQGRFIKESRPTLIRRGGGL